ncbi:hypothetical protein GCM10010360_51280 [Streptomyces nogalater]
MPRVRRGTRLPGHYADLRQLPAFHVHHHPCRIRTGTPTNHARITPGGSGLHLRADEMRAVSLGMR